MGLVEDCESASLGEGKGEGKLQFSGQRDLKVGVGASAL